MPGATVTFPSGFKVMPPLVVVNVPPVKSTSAGSTGEPFKVSLSNTVAVLVPPSAPLTVPKSSSTASITGAVTSMVIVAVSQLVGVCPELLLPFHQDLKLLLHL